MERAWEELKKKNGGANPTQLQILLSPAWGVITGLRLHHKNSPAPTCCTPDSAASPAPPAPSPTADSQPRVVLLIRIIITASQAQSQAPGLHPLLDMPVSTPFNTGREEICPGSWSRRNPSFIRYGIHSAYFYRWHCFRQEVGNSPLWILHPTIGNVTIQRKSNIWIIQLCDDNGNEN